MNLLLITEGENKHYVLIKNFNRFTLNQTKNKDGKRFCMHCVQLFSKESVLNKHKTECRVMNGEQAIKMSDKGEKIMFQNHHKQSPVCQTVIYADFEELTEKIQGYKPNNDK